MGAAKRVIGDFEFGPALSWRVVVPGHRRIVGTEGRVGRSTALPSDLRPGTPHHRSAGGGARRTRWRRGRLALPVWRVPRAALVLEHIDFDAKAPIRTPAGVKGQERIDREMDGSRAG